MEKLIDMQGIGKVSAEKLIKAGVETPEALRKIGSKDALVRVRLNVDDGACLSMLYGLEAAVQGVSEKELKPEVKEDLKEFFAGLKD